MHTTYTVPDSGKIVISFWAYLTTKKEKGQAPPLQKHVYTTTTPLVTTPTTTTNLTISSTNYTNIHFQLKLTVNTQVLNNTAST